MALLRMFEVPGAVAVDLEYNPANFRITAVAFTGNVRRRPSEVKLKSPVRAEVDVKVAGNADAETIAVTGNDGLGLIGPDAEDGDIGVQPNVVLEFQPGEPTV